MISRTVPALVGTLFRVEVLITLILITNSPYCCLSVYLETTVRSVAGITHLRIPSVLPHFSAMRDDPQEFHRHRTVISCPIARSCAAIWESAGLPLLHRPSANASAGFCRRSIARPRRQELSAPDRFRPRLWRHI